MASFILTAAIRAVKSRIGTWSAYDTISDLAPDISREQWAAAIGEARAAIAQRVAESVRPLNRIPTGDEVTPSKLTGVRSKYLQTVEIFVSDRRTGARSSFYYTYKTDTLRSRLTAVNRANEFLRSIIDASPEEYDVDVLGSAYTGTYSTPHGAVR